jgi:hypothetical protein
MIYMGIFIMGYDVNGEKKSSGVAKAGLTLGIIGTGLAGLLAANNGGGFNLGGFLGGNTTRAEEEQSTIAALGSKIGKLESMRYTDQVGLELYEAIIAASNREDEKISNLQNMLFGYVIDLDKRTALNAQASELNRAYDTMARNYEMTILNNKIDCCCEKADMRTAFNRELGNIADASIISYVNSTFLPGTLKLPITSVCPTPVETTTA